MPGPSLPPPALLTPERVSALMALLFGETLSEADAVEVTALLPALQTLESGWRARWDVGGQVVRFYGYKDEPLHPSQLGCACGERTQGRACVHARAVLLAVAWQLEEGRAWFHRPVWELRLQGLLPGEGVRPGSSGDDRHDGWVRYRFVAREAPDPALAWSVERSLVRLGKRDGEPLKPMSCPETWEAIEGRVRGLRPADRELHHLLAEHEELQRLYESRWQALSARGRGVLERLADRVLIALADMEDVWLDEARVKVARAPCWPVMRAEDSPGGGLTLAWHPEVRRYLPFGSGAVLTEEGVMRPLAPDFPAKLRPALASTLPDVPGAEVNDFVRRMVAEGGLPVDLSDADNLPVLDADAREARLVLDEVGRQLLIDLRFSYTLGDYSVLSVPGEGSTLLPLPGEDETWIRRDPAWEQARRAWALERLPEGLPARLQGDAAVHFLAERLPELSEGLAVFGQERLLANRLRGVLEPQVNVPAGVDWFDVQVDFELEGQRLGLRAVLEAWLAGHAFSRLPDGSLARLPEAWLTRHAQALQELEAARKGQRVGLGLHAVPLAEDLLEEAGEHAARWRELAAALRGFEGVPERALPEGFTATLRPYQADGYRWLCWLRELGLGACLADDMGLGKTVQALAMLADAPRGLPSLVVAPTSVIDNWLTEAQRFAPGLRVMLHRGPRRRLDLDDIDLVVTSYGVLRQDREPLSEVSWRCVLLDEAHVIKNPASQVSRAARALQAEHRVALTGTPMENSLGELWSVFQFLMPGFFGPRASFMRRVALPASQGDAEALARLRERLRPFLLRRLKREVAAELPPRQDILLRCELPPPQRALYDELLRAYRGSVAQAVAERGVAGSRLHVLEALTRLRQACCDPALLPDPESHGVEGSAKLDVLMQLLDGAVADGHRSLVFSQWPSFLARAASRLEARGWSYLLLQGDTRGRGALVERWNDPEGPPVFLISLRAGGVGLNLTGADHVIHLDPWWNPAAEDQATDRAHRIGQTKPVTVYKIVAKATVEDRIIALQARKRALFEAALEEDRLVVDQLSAEDLDRVLAEEDL